MAERKFIFSIGEFYHLYNRGVDKRPIFLDRFDRGRFLALLHGFRFAITRSLTNRENGAGPQYRSRRRYATNP